MDLVRRHWPLICMWQDRRESIVKLDFDDTLSNPMDQDYYV